jgi:hypothetical protein
VHSSHAERCRRTSSSDTPYSAWSTDAESC